MVNVYKERKKRECEDWIYDSILTGRGSSIPDEKFDPLQLEIGISVELEHTDSREVAKAIAKDHLVEHRFLLLVFRRDGK